jgi:hypothetical protein
MRARSLALGRQEELLHEPAVEERRHLGDPVAGDADDPALVVVVGSADDAGS